MNADAVEMISRADGVATTADLLTVMTRQQLDVAVRRGRLIRVWRGVYSVEQPDDFSLAEFHQHSGHAVACLHTAAALYGFGVEDTGAVHVLDPGSRLRSGGGLVVHQREGAPLQLVTGRRATSPGWTAVEVARQVRRPRAPRCSPADLAATIDRHRGRRGIVTVRNLLPLADGRAESAMESEARLVMIDHGLPRPELQHLIRGRHGECWRVDFAWPQVGWIVIPIVVDDVHRHPARLCERIRGHLDRASLAS